MLTIDANNYRITASRGDDHKIRFTVKNSSGVAYDVSANAFAFTVKASLDDSLADAKFQKTNPAGSGIDLTLAATGIVDVNLVPADTASLGGPYYYDLQMTEVAKIYTLRQGIFFVSKDVTSVGASPPVPGIGYLVLNNMYLLDVTTGLYWKVMLDSGNWRLDGPSASYPF